MNIPKQKNHIRFEALNVNIHIHIYMLQITCTVCASYRYCGASSIVVYLQVETDNSHSIYMRDSASPLY